MKSWGKLSLRKLERIQSIIAYLKQKLLQPVTGKNTKRIIELVEA